MAFTQKYLSAQFTLGQGQFGDSGFNQLTVGVSDPMAPFDPSIGGPSGALRMSARIDRAGGAALAALSMDIWGMKLSDMNTLSTLGYVATTVRRNSILVKAGDKDGMTTVFNGTIYDAYVDLSYLPDVRFHINAQAVMADALAPAKPSSWQGAIDVSTILTDIAGQLGASAESNGVSVKLYNQYLYGSLIDQAQEAVDAAGIAWNKLEDGKLAWWMPGQARGTNIPLVSKDTGLQTYPAYQSNGIFFTTLFNPGISFGGKVNVQSGQLLQNQTNAAGNVTKVGGSGTWAVTMLNHRLDCFMPRGSWHSDVACSPVGYVVAP